MQSKYACLIVDDDEIDRLTTLSAINRHSNFQVAATCASAEEAIIWLQNNPLQVKIAFLDVDMPGMSGLELRRQISSIPVTVFITAYPEYAVESFELEALDFLVKPFRPERFVQTVARINEWLELQNKVTLLEHSIGADTIFIKEGNKQIKINMHTVLYLEALKDYTCLVTTHGKHYVLKPISVLLKEEAFKSFLRIHKSYAIQKHFIESVNSNEVILNGIRLPVGRVYKNVLHDLT